MTAIAAVLFALFIGFLYPMFGVAGYLLAITVASKTIGMAHLDTDVVSVSDAFLVSSLISLSRPAIGRMWHGRCFSPGLMYSLLWLLSVMVVVAGMLSPVPIKIPLFEALWFGPLVLSLYQLDRDKAKQLLYVVVGVSACIGGLATLLGTNSFSWLASHVQVQLQTVTSGATTEEANARVILPGIWTITPFGFWVAVGLLAAGGVSPRMKYLLSLSVALILLGLMVNYSRSVAVPFVLGPLALVVIAAGFRHDASAKRALLIMGSLILVGAVLIAARPTVRQNWAEKFFGAKRQGTIDARVQASSYLYQELKSKGEILGAAPTVDLREITRLGDPLAPLIVWQKLGIAGMVLFMLVALGVPLIAIWRTFNSLRRYRRIGTSDIVTIGYTFYFAAVLLSGFYFSLDMLFPLVTWYWITCLPAEEPTTLPLALPAVEATPA
jgi:uncharacterized membrane protein